jgi:hypothetical protein
MRRGAQGQTDQGLCLFEPQASLHETPAGPSTGGRLLGSDTDFAAMRSIAPAGRAIGSANSGSDPNNLSRHQGRLFLAYFLLAKQKTSESPAAATERLRNASKDTVAKSRRRLRQAQPERGWDGNGNGIRIRAFSGSEHKFPALGLALRVLRFAAQRNCDPTPKTRMLRNLSPNQGGT